MIFSSIGSLIRHFLCTGSYVISLYLLRILRLHQNLVFIHQNFELIQFLFLLNLLAQRRRSHRALKELPPQTNHAKTS